MKYFQNLIEKLMLIEVVIPNQEMATPFLDLKTLTGFGFQFTKV
jgi:hypothetical protein